MRASWNKLVRDTLQTSILSQYKKKNPNIDQYINRLRFPTVPRIVIYSSVQGVESYLQKIFPLYKYITPTLSLENDQILTRAIAEQLTMSLEGEFGGYLIKGFPFNTNQALMLDRYLNGVNLAVHLKGKQQTQDQSVSSLLNYYDQRGTLLRLNYNQNPSAEQLEWTIRQVVSNIKISQ